MQQIINYREINNAVMTDTMEMCRLVESLKKSIDNSIKNEYVVYQSEPINAGDIQKNLEMKVHVSKKRTFEAAEAYKGKKICCLDFANYYSMGGAPWSAGAQEESMCRVSTLYPCLQVQEQAFYKKHFIEEDKGEINYMGGHDLIYIPGVTVFKTDESIPKLKDEDTWFNIDVIVAAAPELFDDYDEAQYYQVMTERIKRILELAAKEKVEVLILGAFGCGAFGNPPEIVADIFASLIKNYNFETVEFAVFCRNDTKNYDVFESRFAKL